MMAATRRERANGTMNRLIRLCAGLICLAGLNAGFLPALDLVDKGAFAIYNNGKPVGSEEFDISLMGGAGRLHSKVTLRVMREAEIQDVIQESDLVLEANLVPRSYKLTSRISFQEQTLNVEFKPLLALCQFDLGLEKKTEAVVLATDATVIDYNVFSHWTVLLSRLHPKAKGGQTFPVFVPQLGQSGAGPVTVTPVGRDSVNLGASRSKAALYRVQSPNLVLEIWFKNGRILKINDPANKTEVVRAQ